MTDVEDPIAHVHTAEAQARGEKWDELLAQARRHVAQERPNETVTLQALLGEHEPLAGHRGFFARAPRLRQQIEMAQIVEQANDDDGAAANMRGAANLARMAVFVDEDGKMRQATVDEVLDEFNADEVSAILAKYMGIKTKTEDSGPNA